MKTIYGPGTYIGMINKTSGLASGFGRYIWVPFNIWEGQFYEGSFMVFLDSFITMNCNMICFLMINFKNHVLAIVSHG